MGDTALFKNSGPEGLRYSSPYLPSFQILNKQTRMGICPPTNHENRGSLEHRQALTILCTLKNLKGTLST